MAAAARVEPTPLPALAVGVGDTLAATTGADAAAAVVEETAAAAGDHPEATAHAAAAASAALSLPAADVESLLRTTAEAEQWSAEQRESMRQAADILIQVRSSSG
jgi:hypothetical protein